MAALIFWVGFCLEEMNFFTFLIICPLVGLAGFVDAIAGGGGFISLPAYLIAGVPPINSIATNKVSSAMGTTLATYRYGKMGYINWKYTIPAAVLSLIGSYLGATLAMKISNEVFKIIMLILLPLMAFYVLRTRAFTNERTDSLTPTKTMLITAAIGLPIGVYDGFYGPGTGTILMMLLTGVARYRLNDAAGTTKVINLTTNIAALLTYLFSGKVFFLLGLTAGIFNIIGAYLGTKFFSEKGAKIAKPLIIIVLIIFFIKVIGELIGIW